MLHYLFGFSAIQLTSYLSVNYQFGWRPYVPSEWYPGQSEILQYLQTVAKEYDFYRYIRFEQELLQASWTDNDSKWTVQIKDLTSGKSYDEQFDLFLDLTGAVAKPLSPQVTVPGIDAFSGLIIHPSNWPSDVDLTRKRVALLGYGASGIQLAPNIIDKVDKLYTWFRNKTYVMPPSSQGDFPGNGGLSFQYSDEQKTLLQDPDVLRTYINKVEEEGHGRWQAYVNGSDMSVKGTEGVQKYMRERLASKPGLYEQIVAEDFDILCRRPTFAHGYLEALVSAKTTVLPQPPQHFTSKGFLDADGTEHEIDIVIAATGYEQRGLPGYTLDVNCVNMNEILADHSSPRVYMSIMREDIPNYFHVGSSYSWLYGSWTQSVAAPSAYIVKVIDKMQTENILSLKPSSRAVDHFIRHSDAFLQRTVTTGPCVSWYKSNARSRPAVWPGNRSHWNRAFLSPRFEDLDIRYVDEEDMFSFLGNGFCLHPDGVEGSDVVWYMRKPESEVGPEVLEKLHGKYGIVGQNEKQNGTLIL